MSRLHRDFFGQSRSPQGRRILRFVFCALAALSLGVAWADQPAKPQSADKQSVDNSKPVATSRTVKPTDSASTASASIPPTSSSNTPASKSATVDGKAADSKAANAKTAESTSADNKPKERAKRVLFIVVKNSLVCDQELARLKKKGGDFEAMRARGWSIGPGPENHLQIISCDDVPEVVEKLQLKEFPTVVGLEDGEVGRYFRYGCTTPLDAWTFGFLLKGIDERPPGMVKEAARVDWTGHYPLRGNHWSVEGDWNPTREKTLEHLHGPNHQSQLEASWHIEDWSLEELRSAHDDLHEKYDIGGGSGSSSSSSSSGSSYLKYKGGR